MSKVAALEQLSSWGLPTPPTVVFGAGELPGSVPDSWLPPFYVRGDHPQFGKTGKMGDRKSIEAFVAEAELVGYKDFSLQPILSFEFGGACAIFDRSDTYFEIVHGMPLGLLRHGQLALSCRERGTEVTWFDGEQSEGWAVRDLKIEREAIHTRQREALRANILAARNQLASRDVTGLFEWGIVDGQLVWVDWRKYDNLSALRDLIDSALSQATRKTRINDERPTLANWTGALDLHFNAGARLSHVVTYALGQAGARIRFTGW